MLKRLINIYFAILISHSLIAQKPNWLESISRSELFPSKIYFQGFKFSNKGLSETRDELTKRLISSAKEELIESISVRIKSSSTLITENSGRNFNQKFKKQISAFSEAELFGLSTETYFDEKKNEGFAFVFVNKSKLINYHTNFITTKYGQGNQKLLNLNNATNENLKYNISELYSILSIILEIKRSQNMLISLNSANDTLSMINKSLKLEKIVCQNLFKIFAKITISPSDSSIKPSFNNSLQYPISVIVKYDNNPIEAIPIVFQLVNDSFKINPTKTNKNGVGTTILNNIKLFGLNKKIRSNLNLSLFVDSIAFKFFDIFNIPSREFDLSFKKTLIYINLNESCNDIVISKLKEVLAEYGFQYTSNEAVSNFKILLTCSSRNKFINNFVFKYVDITLEIIDSSSGNSLYQTKIQDCKGGGSDIEQASNKAFQLASKTILDSLMNFLTK